MDATFIYRLNVVINKHANRTHAILDPQERKINLVDSGNEDTGMIVHLVWRSQVSALPNRWADDGCRTVDEVGKQTHRRSSWLHSDVVNKTSQERQRGGPAHLFIVLVSFISPFSRPRFSCLSIRVSVTWQLSTDGRKH